MGFGDSFKSVYKPKNTIGNMNPVKVRDYINTYGKRYGIENDDIGYRSDPKTKTGTVTLGGSDLVTPAKIENGSSYYDENLLRSHIDSYAKKNNLYNTNPEAPAAHVSPYKDETDNLLKEILNAPKFSYDKNTDSTYNQYKEEYTNNADKTFEDTMGDMDSLTSGRPNSWAATVASQARQGVMQELDNMVPQLEEKAYGRYQNDLTDKINKFGVLQNAESADYGKHRDTVSDFNNDRSFGRGVMESDRAFDFNKDQADYQVSRDKILDDQWLRGFDETKRRSLVDEALSKRQISISEANAALTRSKVSQEATDTALLNTSFKGMMSAKDPSDWLSKNKSNLTPGVYSDLAKMIPSSETLGPLYTSMMTAKDPKTGAAMAPEDWLKQNSTYLDDDELKALENLLPKQEDPLLGLIRNSILSGGIK